MTPAERRRAGISDGLLRVSAGIEDVQDLINDFTDALAGDDRRSLSLIHI